MIRGAWRWILLGVILMLVVGMASALSRMVEDASPVSRAMEMRDELTGLRQEVDACRSVQDQAELRFEALTRRTERHQSEIDSLEALDPRGVPSDSYDDYLDLVDRFNAAVEAWDRQGDELRAYAERCRELIRVHNARADSLRGFLVEHGIWEAGWVQSEDPEFVPGGTIEESER